MDNMGVFSWIGSRLLEFYDMLFSTEFPFAGISWGVFILGMTILSLFVWFVRTVFGGGIEYEGETKVYDYSDRFKQFSSVYAKHNLPQKGRSRQYEKYMRNKRK